jgi:hypothetical protein
VRDNRKRFGPRTEQVCAVVKDMAMGTTKWRKGGKKHLSAQGVPTTIDLSASTIARDLVGLYDELAAKKSATVIDLAEFDPAKHPRDPLGRFAGSLKTLARGHGKAHLPSGISVHRSQTHFVVKGRNGHVLGEHRDPVTAARQAFNKSAQSTHPKSIGGTRSFRSFDDFKRARGKSLRVSRRGVSERGSVTRPFRERAPKPIRLSTESKCVVDLAEWDGS